MKKPECLILGLAMLFSLPAARAQSPQLAQPTDGKKVPLDVFHYELSYVFESDLNHGGRIGSQDAFEGQMEYGHRILLNGNWYLHLGMAFDRFDFRNTSAPVPVHLQSGAAVIGFDYMKGSDVGAFLELRPGFYTEEHIGLASFDCPITLARFFILRPDKLYLLIGVNAAFLRGGYPVIPLGGLVWIASDRVRVLAVPPEPRVIYSLNNKLDLWAGGEIVGGSFRTDRDNGIVPAQLSGAAVNYIDYRAGAGLNYSLNEQISFNVGAGYSIERSFNFVRADLHYRTDPAPYLRLQFKAKF
jgi:hypothetical protein